MEKIIKKIVLTGGPCAGKSTALSRIEEEFTKLGYRVLIVPESATELFSNGVAIGDEELSAIEFQTVLMQHQINKEEIFEKIADFMPSEKILIVCDRGLMDSKAYCTSSEFSQIMQNIQTNEPALRSRYDAVFHLKTAADGAEAFYTLENNAVRKETVEEAKALDEKTIRAWFGHPRLRIFDNETNFMSKINRLIAEISKFLGQPIPIEIQRKYLIQMPNLDFLTQKMQATKLDIVQSYLPKKNDEEVRIRQTGTDGNYVYYLVVKKTVDGLSHIKSEKRISQNEYLRLLMSADPNLKPVKKERYCFVYKNQYFELDVHPFWKEQAIVEIKPTEENRAIQFPEFIKVIREVTQDSAYKNYSLATMIPLEA